MKAHFEKIRITGISAHLPQRIVGIEDFSEQFGEEEVQRISASTGVKSVRYATEDECASDLCYAAATSLFRHLNIKASEIDALIFVTQTPDYKIPGNSYLLHSRLGLRNDALCIDLSAGCAGFIFGLFQACMILNSTGSARVLLLTGETNSKLIDEQDRSLRMVFGDAGTACLIEKGEGEMSFNLKNDGADYQYLYQKRGAYRFPLQPNSSSDEMREACLTMDGMEVMNFALREVPSLVQGLLEDSKWRPEECLFGLHQANAFMLQYLRKKIRLPEANMPIKLQHTGNTGAASIPLMLSILGEQDNAFKFRNQSILCGFGVGLAWAGCTADLSKTKFISPE